MNYSVKRVPLGILLSLLHANVALAGFPRTVKVEPTGAIPNVETNTHTAEINIAPAARTGSAAAEFVEVTANGLGTDQPSALNNAYSNAIQQALGLYVDAETMVQNNEIVRDQILTHSKGFIEKTDIVSEGTEGNLYQVTIRAQVRRQQLLEKVQTSNISVKPFEGVNLHAQLETTAKQGEDAKAILAKVLLPLVQPTWMQVELESGTTDHPNPTMNKEQINDETITLQYRFKAWIDDAAYFAYVKDTLLPALKQIAIRTGTRTAQYKMDDKIEKIEKFVTGPIFTDDDKQKFVAISVLTWKNKALTSSKWQWFIIDKEQFLLIKDSLPKTSTAFFELSLLDEQGEPISFGNTQVSCKYTSECDMPLNALNENEYDFSRVRVAPYGCTRADSQKRFILIPKAKSYDISVTIGKDDLPQVKNVKLTFSNEGQ